MFRHPEARCMDADPEAFFPEKAENAIAAKQLCNGTDDTDPCPARSECLDYALDNGEKYGVWGGMAEMDRRLIGYRNRPWLRRAS